MRHTKFQIPKEQAGGQADQQKGIDRQREGKIVINYVDTVRNEGRERDGERKNEFNNSALVSRV